MGTIIISTMPKFDDINGGTKDLFWHGSAFQFLSPFSYPDCNGYGYTAKVTGPKVDFFGLTDLPTFTPYIKSVKDANFTDMANGTFPFGAGKAVVGFKVGEIDLAGVGFTLDKLEFDGDATTVETKYAFRGIDKNISLGVNGMVDLGKNVVSLKKIKLGHKDVAGANVNYMYDKKKEQHFVNAGYCVNNDLSTGLQIERMGENYTPSLAVSYGTKDFSAGVLASATGFDLKAAAVGLDVSSSAIAPDVKVGANAKLVGEQKGLVELAAMYTGIADAQVNAAVTTKDGAYQKAAVAVKYTGFTNQVAKFELNLDRKKDPQLSMMVEFA